ncbi:uncharacterized protein LOC143460588 [Clavelina lepadiformis]|uniref:uncharacterized protein LOC143460588 n=1 Tax=Clavelina lepadiformis TaxID=159417 RepID=UPI004042782C
MAETSSSAEAENPIGLFKADEIICNASDYILGKGGYGMVLLGFHTRSGSRLAMKCQLPEKTGRAADVARSSLIKELQMLRLVKNEHVVRIEGLLEWKGCLFGIVMEHMPGGSLKDLIFHPVLERIPPPLLLRIGCDVSDALSHLHTILKDRRIAHGDLKPDNILMTTDLRCKVADFGGAALAGYTGSLGAGPDKPGEGNQLTHCFAAPERLVPGCNRLTTAMDVYSYGVILLVAICRVYPSVFHSTQKQEMINNFKQHLKLKGDDVGVKIITMLETVLCKCLDFNPKVRPSMTNIKSELFSFLQTIDGEMQGCVAEICRQIRIRDDKLDEKNCKTISDVIADLQSTPDADQPDEMPIAKLANDVMNAVVIESKISEKTSNVAERETNNEKYFLKYSDNGSTCNFQSITNLLQSVKSLITEGKFDNALEICKELLFVMRSINLRADDSEMLACDVINLVKSLAEEKPSLILLELIQMANRKLVVTVPAIKFYFIRKLAQCAQMTATYGGVKHQKDMSGRVIEFANNLIESISSLSCEDKEMVIKAKASCWICKAACYGNLDNKDHQMELNLQSVTLIEKEFEDKCQMTREYAASCNNLAINYNDKDQLEKAETYFLKSFDAFQKVTDYEDEEMKLKNINISITNMCNLYEVNPSMTRSRAKDIYKYLQSKQHPPGFRQLESKVLLLRLALLLNDFVDAKIHSNDVISMSNNIPLTPTKCEQMCWDIKCVAKSFFHHNKDNLAVSLLQYGVNLCKLISNPLDKLAPLLNLSGCIVVRVNERTFESAQQIAIITTSFIPLCKEMINMTRECRGADELKKQICLSLQLKYISDCYLQAENYPQSLATASEALRILPEDTSEFTQPRDVIVGELDFVIGVSHYNLGHFDLGKSALEKAMKVLKDTNKDNYDTALENLTYWEKRRK